MSKEVTNKGTCGHPITNFENVISDMTSNVSGKILTVIDAAIPEGNQNKSIKDIIRLEFSRLSKGIWEHFDWYIRNGKVKIAQGEETFQVVHR